MVHYIMSSIIITPNPIPRNPHTVLALTLTLIPTNPHQSPPNLLKRILEFPAKPSISEQYWYPSGDPRNTPDPYYWPLRQPYSI